MQKWATTLGTKSGRECEMMSEVKMGMGLEIGLTAGLGMVLDMVLQKKKGLRIGIGQ